MLPALTHNAWEEEARLAPYLKPRHATPMQIQAVRQAYK